MEKATRRRRRDNASDAANIKLRNTSLGTGGGSLADKFAASLAEKEDRKAGLEMLEGAYKKMAEKKKMETERFKSEMAKMMDSDEDDSLEKRREARKKNEGKLRKPGKLKGKWDNFAKDQEEAEKKKLDAERKRREKKDREERIKAKRDLEEKGEDLTDHSKMLNATRKATRKPVKIKTNFEDLAQKKEEERLRKIAEERYNRVKRENMQMKADKSNWENGIGPDEDQLGDTCSVSRARAKDNQTAPKKLNLNFAEKEAQRQKELEEQLYMERVKRLHDENERMQKEYKERTDSLSDDVNNIEPERTVLNSERVANPGKITSINFLKELTKIEQIEQELAKITDDKHALERIIKEKEEDIRAIQDVNPLDFPDKESFENYQINIQPKIAEYQRIKNQHQELLFQTACSERKLMRELKVELEVSGQKGTIKKAGTMDKSKTQFDQIERERRKKEEDKLYQEKMAKLELERAKMKHEMRLFEIEQKEEKHEEIKEGIANGAIKNNELRPKKLDTKLVMIDAVNHSRILQERTDLNNQKLVALQEEMKKFKEQQALQKNQESSDDEDTSKTINIERNFKPGKVNTSFDKQHADELERRRQELQNEKMRLLDEEIHFMKAARMNGDKSGYSSDGSIDVKSSCNIQPMRQDDILLRAPKKLNKKIFENTDLERKRQLDAERIKMERDEKLRQERELFAAQSREQQDMEYIQQSNGRSSEEPIQQSLPKSPTKKSHKKINADNYLKMLQEQQRKQDEDALMEQRMERMAMEQHEMLISAQKNEMDEQFYASEDEVSYSDDDDDYDSEERQSNQASGAPIFIEHLDKTMDVMEGHPVRFDCQVNMYPHGNVIWYYLVWVGANIYFIFSKIYCK